MAELTGFISTYIDAVILIFFLLLFCVFALFSLERALYRLYLMFQVRRLWFPEGRFVLLCHSDDALWNGYIEDELLPEIADDAVVVRAPLPQAGRRGGPLGARLVRAFGPGECAAPLAIVFRPYFEHERLDFSDAFENLRAGSDHLLKKQHARLVELVKDQRARMGLYL